jgi:hypothetical protein
MQDPSGHPLQSVHGDVVNSFPEAEVFLYDAATALVSTAAALVKADVGGVGRQFHAARLYGPSLRSAPEGACLWGGLSPLCVHVHMW